ncbi:MAG TPA: sulfatase-like hydrolase/transferase [Actinomycetota bacterium]|nr:sulfatase-like hydrolase/transferase [Actinomycetota bacterium]
MMTDPMSRRPSRLRSEIVLFLEVLVVSSFAVGQPVLDVFGKSPETFVFADAGRLEIAAFGVLVMALPPLVLWILATAAGLAGRRVRVAAHIALIWGLCAVVGVQVLKKFTPLPELALAVGGAAVGTALTWVLFGPWSIRRWLAQLWPAPIAFLMVFLFLSDVSKLVLPAGDTKRASGKRPNPVPIVMVNFDQFPLLTLIGRDGRINQRRFPNFAALAENAFWYRNYTITESYTDKSMPTILSGAVVTDRSKTSTARDHPNTLFTLLGDTHRMAVFESVTRLCPPDLCRPPTQRQGGLSTLMVEARDIWVDISLPRRIERDITAQFEERVETPTTGVRRGFHRRYGRPLMFAEFLKTFRRNAPPTLYFLHLLLPHNPWRFYPSGVEYGRTIQTDAVAYAAGSQPERYVDHPWPVRVMRLRHVLQAIYVDRLLGDLVDRLKKTGIYDDALIVITSDQGRSFGAGRPRGAMVSENLHEIIWVPLLIKMPQQKAGAVVDAGMTAPDLLPTIADALGTNLPWRSDGSSALHRRRPRQTKTVVRHSDGNNKPLPRRRLSITVDEAWRRLRAEVFEPAANSVERLYEIGPARGFIGRPVGSLLVGPRASGVAELHVPVPNRVDPARGPLPGLIVGTLESPERADSVVIALNGTVAGRSPLFREGQGPTRFMSLLPERAFRIGSNRVEMFLMRDGVLHPLRIEGSV